jgi:gluconokinase
MSGFHPPCPSVPAAIVVMGVSGSGKSTLASRLAMRLDGEFIEGDALHAPASIAKMAAGQPLDDDDRWPWLDRIGSALQRAAVGGGKAVAACSALKSSYRARLQGAAGVPVFFILLEAPLAELARRLESRRGHFMPASLLDSQLATLERPQGSERALLLDAVQPPAQLCEASYRWLAAQVRQ